MTDDGHQVMAKAHIALARWAKKGTTLAVHTMEWNGLLYSTIFLMCVYLKWAKYT